MAHIDILGPTAKRGASLLINGHDTPDLLDFSLHLAVDEAVRCNLSVLASGDLHFSGEADLQVTVQAMPGFRILESRSDGIKTYTCEPEPNPSPSGGGSPIARAEENIAPRFTFMRFMLCWFGIHKWRIGTLDEFPPGTVGCLCGARKLFSLFKG